MSFFSNCLITKTTYFFNEILTNRSLCRGVSSKWCFWNWFAVLSAHNKCGLMAQWDDIIAEIKLWFLILMIMFSKNMFLSSFDLWLLMIIFSKNMSSSSFVWSVSIYIRKSYNCWFRKYLNLLWMAMAWEEEMLKKSTFFVTSLGYHNDSHLSTNLNSKAPKIKELQARKDLMRVAYQ